MLAEAAMKRVIKMVLGAVLFLGFSGVRGQDTQSLYVTRQDCRQLVAHHPDPGVEYKPGVDVRGKYVAPADLPNQANFNLPDKIEFDLRLNPLAYAPQSGAPAGAFQNTATNLGHVEMDLGSGKAKLNGHTLDDEQTSIVTEACRKAGYR